MAQSHAMAMGRNAAARTGTGRLPASVHVPLLAASWRWTQLAPVAIQPLGSVLPSQGGDYGIATRQNLVACRAFFIFNTFYDIFPLDSPRFRKYSRTFGIGFHDKAFQLLFILPQE